MKSNLDDIDIHKWLQENPSIEYFYKKRLKTCISKASKKLSGKNYCYQMLDCKLFYNTFDSLNKGFGVTKEQEGFYNRINTELKLAIFFSEQNKKDWYEGRTSVKPEIFDLAISEMTAKKILTTISNIKNTISEAELSENKMNREIKKDLVDYSNMLSDIYIDSIVATHKNRSDELQPLIRTSASLYTREEESPNATIATLFP